MHFIKKKNRKINANKFIQYNSKLEVFGIKIETVFKSFITA